jgi:hypothetical protein
MRKRVCIISFSPIYRDGRILRQIECLLPFYDIDIIGEGDCPEKYKNDPRVRFFNQIRPEIKSPIKNFLDRSRKFVYLAYTILKSWINPTAFENWYWSIILYQEAIKYAIKTQADIYLANDWTALPIASESAKKNKACLLFDAHEYAPLEFEDNWRWKMTYPAIVRYFINKYTAMIDGFITVSPQIGIRYQKEFGLFPTIILNAPDIPQSIIDSNNYPQIHLIHHGGAMRIRKLERMIETLQYCDERFRLHFMLIEADHNYSDELKQLAQKIVPGRVEFHDPVAPIEVPRQISQYDIGFFLLEPVNYNYRMALPNKLFDFIAAGLAICIGPSPEMAKLVNEYGLGVVAPSFNPVDVAKVLNRLTYDQIDAMKKASHIAALTYNARTETQKLVKLCADALRKKGEVCVESLES